MGIQNFIKKEKDRLLQLTARASSITSIITGILAITGVGIRIAIPTTLLLNVILFAILFAVEFSGDTIEAFRKRFDDKFSSCIVSDEELTVLYELRSTIDTVISASEMGSVGREPI